MSSLTVKQWRLAKGFSQEYMARKLYKHRNTYASMEDNPETISIGDAKKISAILGESIDDIFFAK